MPAQKQGAGPRARSGRAVKTLLFTDIVGLHGAHRAAAGQRLARSARAPLRGGGRGGRGPRGRADHQGRRRPVLRLPLPRRRGALRRAGDRLCAAPGHRAARRGPPGRGRALGDHAHRHGGPRRGAGERPGRGRRGAGLGARARPAGRRGLRPRRARHPHAEGGARPLAAVLAALRAPGPPGGQRPSRPRARPRTWWGASTSWPSWREAIGRTAAGRGSLWMLSGEPGVGKTRLADAAESVAGEAGLDTFWGRCWEGGGAPAYWAWTQVVRAMQRAEPGGGEGLGPLGPDPHSGAEDTEDARFALFDSFTSFVEERADPAADGDRARRPARRGRPLPAAARVPRPRPAPPAGDGRGDPEAGGARAGDRGTWWRAWPARPRRCGSPGWTPPRWGP